MKFKKKEGRHLHKKMRRPTFETLTKKANILAWMRLKKQSVITQIVYMGDYR